MKTLRKTIQLIEHVGEDPQPDKLLTEKIKKAGQLFDIKVLDHLILTPDGDYFSFADEGLI